jgi:hypothetical protein
MDLFPERVAMISPPEPLRLLLCSVFDTERVRLVASPRLVFEFALVIALNLNFAEYFFNKKSDR